MSGAGGAKDRRDNPDLDAAEQREIDEAIADTGKPPKWASAEQIQQHQQHQRNSKWWKRN